jgi:hypothetical protein
LASWSFDSLAVNTFIDNSGNGYNASWTGTAVGLVPGVKGNALRAPDSGFEITVANSRDSFYQRQFTIEGWINSNLGPADGTDRKIWDFSYIEGGVRNGISFYINAASSNVTGSMSTRDGSAWEVVNSASVVQADTWYHVAYSYDGTMLRVYVNGNLDGSLAYQGTYIPSGIDARIGCYKRSDYGVTGFFNGKIDELKYYNYALPPDSILAHYTLIPPAPVLISPANGAVNQPLALTLAWSTVNSAKSYALQVSTSSTFASFVRNRTGLTSPRLSVGRLAGNTTYYWRADATGAGGTGSWTGAWSFTTLSVPAAPVLALPSNNAVVAATPFTLSWSTVSLANNYVAQVSTSSAFISYSQYRTTSGTVAVTNITVNSAYYWRVRAANSAGNGPWSEIRRFNLKTPSVSALSADRREIEFAFSNCNGILRYSIPRSCTVKLTFCDIQGRTIIGLNRLHSSGNYHLSLSEFHLAAGMYLVHFKAGSFEKKVTLLIR